MDIENDDDPVRGRVPTAIADALPGMVAYWDRDLLCRYANTAYLEWFGKDPKALIGRSIVSLLGEALFTANEPYIRGALRGEKQKFERRLHKPDGTIGYTLAHYIPDIDEHGTVNGFFVLVVDISEIKKTEEELSESQSKYKLLAENSTDIVYFLDLDFNRQYVSRDLTHLIGYSSEALIGRSALEETHPDDVQHVGEALCAVRDARVASDTVRYRKRHRDGHWVWIEADLRLVRDSESGKPTGIVGSVRDISARKRMEDQLIAANRDLARLAAQDGLTGLANRRIFEETLAKEWRSAERARKCVGLIMVDVDWFKSFNDRYGHQAGDECLRQVGAAIHSQLRRPRDLAARYGGEEFVVLLPETDASGTALVAEHIRETVVGLGIAHADNPSGVVTVSLGFASVQSTCITGSADLVNLADSALYNAKALGRNRAERAMVQPKSRG